MIARSKLGCVPREKLEAATTSRVACRSRLWSEHLLISTTFFSQQTLTFISNHGLVVVIRFNSGSRHKACFFTDDTNTDASINDNTSRSAEEAFTRQRLRGTVRFLREAFGNDDLYECSTTAFDHSTRTPTCNARAKRNTHTLRPLALRLNRAAITHRRTPRHLPRSPLPTPNVLPSSLRPSILLPIPRRQIQRHLPIRRIA